MKSTFYLDKSNGKFMGVCSGLANYTGVDATWIRVGLVVTTLLGGFPWTLIAYGVAAWMGKPAPYTPWQDERIAAPRASTYDVRESMRDIDRRMAEVETYVTGSNSRLAREIEELR